MVNKSWLNVAGLETRKFAAIPKGEEKFAFLYAVIAAIAVGCAMTFSWIVGLVWWQAVLLVIGCLIGAWATLFSFLEVHRLNAAPKSAEEALREEVDPYASRSVVVDPPTGDPYPHHEDYAQSSGQDQGQLTSRLTDSTPFVDAIMNRRRMAKQTAAKP